MQENRTTSYANIELVKPEFGAYRKLGGFLLAIVIICYVSAIVFFAEAILTLRSYVSFSREIEELLILDVYAQLKTEVLIFTLIYIVLLLVFSFFLLRIAGKIRERDEMFLRHFQLYSLIALGVSVIAAVVFVLIASDFVSIFLALLIITCVIWAAILVLSSLYFSRSKRVCVFMGSDAYLRDSLFNRNTPSPLKPYEPELEKVIAEREAAHKKRYMDADSDPTKWICPCCGKENKTEDEICPSCNEPKPLGAIINRWRCKQCGRINLGTFETCPCGDTREHGTLLRDET